MKIQLWICALIVTGINFPISSAHSASQNQFHNRTWMLEHLGPNGLAKCRAFNAVVANTLQLQKAGGGTISPLERRRLSSELAHAKAMTPKSVTPSDCGVPL